MLRAKAGGSADGPARCRASPPIGYFSYGRFLIEFQGGVSHLPVHFGNRVNIPISQIALIGGP